jgi:hypothetical protein
MVSVNAAAMKAKIDAVREAIGRDVTFYHSSNTACPLCTASGYLNPLGGSYYYQCPTCSGSGYTETTTSTVVNARIHWNNDEFRTATPGGKFYVGEATLGIDPSYLDLAERTQTESGKVVVDGHDMQIQKIVPVGAPIINRYRLVLRNMGDRPS